ncbi:MAG: hypothetical protein A2X29_12320 [Elusimicrobia bacterium GWA2_64_40]|nr:MAG: hypothetical protein A2X29_12320 [Elusimicrobia bacterium GWA2_64_40]
MSFKITTDTGDAGLTAEAATPGALLADLAAGFAVLACGGAIEENAIKAISLKAETPESLAVNFLNELVFLADTEGFIAAAASVSASFKPGACELTATLRGEPLAFERHQRGLLVKAATYHGLKIERAGGLWRAAIVLDI